MSSARHPQPCPDREEQLSALLDGDLAPEQRQELEAHVAGCAGCRGGLDELRELRQSLMALGPVVPPSDLFEAVDVAVGRRRNRVLLGASAAVACAGVLAVLLVFGLRRGPEEPLALEARAPVSIRQRVESELQKAETHYRNALVMLRKLAETEKSLWPVERRQNYEADIRLLDGTIEETRRLARRTPTDPALQEMLFASYRSQIDYLRDVLTPRVDESI